jgi:hypothetical protein
MCEKPKMQRSDEVHAVKIVSGKKIRSKKNNGGTTETKKEKRKEKNAERGVLVQSGQVCLEETKRTTLRC